MFSERVVEETRQYASNGSGPDARGLNSLGYREAAGHISGDLDLSQAVDLAKKRTRNLCQKTGNMVPAPDFVKKY